MDIDLYTTPMEFKAVGDAASGEFEAYGAVFGNVDWHGDVIAPGAFKEGLAERTAQGRKVAMHLEHGLPQLGGVKNIGAWKALTEDSKGLLSHGKIAGMNTDTGRLRYEMLREGALAGCSIGYSVRPGGAVMGRKSTDPKRTLIGINITEISLVGDPSNTEATVTQFKTLMRHTDVEAATHSTAAALLLHRSTMSGGDSPNADERGQMLAHLQAIHTALTGEPMPRGMKSRPETIRDFEGALRELGFSKAEAALIAEREFKASGRRDDGGGEARPAADGFGDLAAGLNGFALPKF